MYNCTNMYQLFIHLRMWFILEEAINSQYVARIISNKFTHTDIGLFRGVSWLNPAKINPLMLSISQNKCKPRNPTPHPPTYLSG